MRCCGYREASCAAVTQSRQRRSKNTKRKGAKTRSRKESGEDLFSNVY